MLVRTLRASRAFRAPSRSLREYASTSTTSNQVPANDPVKRDAKPNVSETNAVPLSSEGSFDKVLQEDVADGEKMRTMQAPNFKGTWSNSQQLREVAMSGPRFEQSIMEDQVRQCTFWLELGIKLWAWEAFRGRNVEGVTQEFYNIS
jgi:NADH dehydrogenase (ubiquinone) Fe-S protein 6